MKKRRVAITGVGAVTPAGHTFQETWTGIVEGVSTAAAVTRFDASKMPTNFAYEVKNFTFDTSLCAKAELPMLNDAAQFCLVAADEAFRQAKIAEVQARPERIAVCMGNGMGSPEFDWFSKVFVENRFDDPSVRYLTKNFPFIVSSILGRKVNARGPSVTVHTACASSGQSIGEAFEKIAYNEADVVVTGGSDSMINPFHMAGFCLLGALSKNVNHPKQASRPFDEGRDGFVLGEGACVFVLEDWEHAEKRGAEILAELKGYGITESAYRITDLHPEGHGPIEAMQMALTDADLRPEDVGYVNAHGTSTQLNDRIEALAVSKVFGTRGDVHVSSTKSVTGHMISAAGAIELAVCMEALRRQVLPPSTNLIKQDSQCPVTLTPTIPTTKLMDFALSNSVGFGGSNTALVVGRV